MGTGHWKYKHLKGMCASKYMDAGDQDTGDKYQVSQHHLWLGIREILEVTP